MDFREGTIRCDKHPERKACGICTISDCPNKNLCLHCLNSHEGSHNSRILFVDENLFDADTLLSKTREKREKYLKFLEPMTNDNRDLFGDAKKQINLAFDRISLEINKTINEKREKLLKDLELKVGGIDEETAKNLYGDLMEINFSDMDLLNVIIDKLHKCLEDIYPKIDKVLEKQKINVMDDAKMLEMENKALITLNEGSLAKFIDDINSDINKISLAKIAKIHGSGTQFVYTGTDYDQGGIFYWFGTEKGTKDEWSNPCNGPFLKVEASSVDYGQIEVLTANKLGSFFTKNTLDSWVKFTLLEGMEICVTYYTMSFDDSKYKNGLPRNWNLEGSKDGNEWEVISKHENDQTFTYEHRTHTFAVDCNKYYSFLKFQQTGQDCNGRYYFTLSGLDFYGTINQN